MIMNKSNRILVLVVIIIFVFCSFFTMSACQNEEQTDNFEYEISELVVKMETRIYMEDYTFLFVKTTRNLWLYWLIVPTLIVTL